MGLAANRVPHQRGGVGAALEYLQGRATTATETENKRRVA
jgi:hypothetical protein